ALGAVDPNSGRLTIARGSRALQLDLDGTEHATTMHPTARVTRSLRPGGVLDVVSESDGQRTLHWRFERDEGGIRQVWFPNGEVWSSGASAGEWTITPIGGKPRKVSRVELRDRGTRLVATVRDDFGNRTIWEHSFAEARH